LARNGGSDFSFWLRWCLDDSRSKRWRRLNVAIASVLDFSRGSADHRGILGGRIDHQVGLWESVGTNNHSSASSHSQSRYRFYLVCNLLQLLLL
jgi:hypothetical protein